MPLQARLFQLVGRLIARLPHFRGRTRAGLLLFQLLGLEKKHTFIDTLLTRPLQYRVRLDMHSWLQRIAFLGGGYEAETVRFLVDTHRSVGGKGYLLDVGANVGLVSLPFALSFPQSLANVLPRVVSVEAIPDNVAALRHNIALNGAQGLVSVIDKALGERIGTVDIQVEGDLARGEGTGTANILPAGTVLDPNGTYECVRIPIQVATLDSLHGVGEVSSSCNLIKIDTDGYDLKVLQGGRQFLAKCRPVIFGEFSAHCLRWHGQSINDVIAFADSMDYKVWQRKGDRLMRFTSQLDRATFSQDLLLVPCEQAQAMAWCCD